MPRIEINEEICQGCGLCVISCPKKVLKLSEDKLNQRGFHPACLVDEDNCIGCTFCAVMCPDVAITVYK